MAKRLMCVIAASLALSAAAFAADLKPPVPQPVAGQSFADKLVSERIAFLKSASDAFAKSARPDAGGDEQANVLQIEKMRSDWDGMDAASREKLAASILSRPDNDVVYLDDLIEIAGVPALADRLEKARAAREAEFKKKYGGEKAAGGAAKTAAMQLTIGDSEVFGNSGKMPGQYALTFDDGPVAGHYTASVMDTLQQAGVHGNFFCLGNVVSKNQAILKANSDAGNTINLHSWDHANFSKLSIDVVVDQIKRNSAAVRAVTGKPDSGLFRFPYGNRTREELAQLNKMGYVSVKWNIDTRDWATKDPVQLYANIEGMLGGTSGGIILMHDIHWQSATVLPKVIELLKSKGATFITLVRSDVKQ